MAAKSLSRNFQAHQRGCLCRAGGELGVCGLPAGQEQQRQGRCQGAAAAHQARAQDGLPLWRAAASPGGVPGQAAHAGQSRGQAVRCPQEQQHAQHLHKQLLMHAICMYRAGAARAALAQMTLASGHPAAWDEVRSILPAAPEVNARPGFHQRLHACEEETQRQSTARPYHHRWHACECTEAVDSLLTVKAETSSC